MILSMNIATYPLHDPQAKPPITVLLKKTTRTSRLVVLALMLWPLYAVGRPIWYRQLGIDADALHTQLADYVAWYQSEREGVSWVI